MSETPTPQPRPDEEVRVTINDVPVTGTPTGSPGDIPPRVEAVMPTRTEAESLWQNPLASELRNAEESPKSEQNDFWSNIESNPNFEVAEIIPKQSVHLPTQNLTNKFARSSKEGVIQTLAGVVEVEGTTYALVNVVASSRSKTPAKPHAIITKFSDDPAARPEIVGFASPDKPFEVDQASVAGEGEKAAGAANEKSLRLEIDDNFAINITNLGPNAVHMVAPTQRTKAELTAKFGEQMLGDELARARRDGIVAVGSKAVSLVHDNPFDEKGRWAAMSADVREVLDRSEADASQRSLTDSSEVKVGDKLNAGAVAMFGNQLSSMIRAISLKEQQTDADKFFVSTVVDMTSRIIIDGIETGQLKEVEGGSTEDFKDMALKVESKTPGYVNRDFKLTEILARLTGGEAVVGVDRNRLDYKAEDYAIAVTKYLAMMIQNSGELVINSHNEGNFNKVLMDRDKVLSQEEAAQAA